MITTVTYTRAYIIGAFLQEKIGVEIELSENQDPLEAILEAKKLTDSAHEQANPHLYNGSQPIPEPTTLPTLKVEREPGDAILEGINAADSWDGVKGLKSYQYLVKNNQTWLEAFSNQKIKLGVIG
jgi:hypothetical protein